MRKRIVASRLPKHTHGSNARHPDDPHPTDPALNMTMVQPAVSNHFTRSTDFTHPCDPSAREALPIEYSLSAAASASANS